MTFGHAVIDGNPALIFALVPVIVSHLRIDLAHAGALVTLLLMTSSITQPVFGFLQDRRPLFPTASLGLLLAGAAMAATGFVATYAQMVVLVLIAGLGIAAFHPQAVAQAGRASDGRTEWGIAIFFTGGSTGTAIMSLAIVPLVAMFGPHATLVALVPAVVTAALFARAYSTWLGAEARAEGSPTAASSMRAVARPLSLLLSVVVTVSLITGMVGLLPVPWLPASILVPWMFVAGVLMFASEAQVTALAQRLLPAFVGVASSLMMGVGLGIGNVGAFVTGAIADRRGIQFAITAVTLLLGAAAVASILYMLSLRKVRA